MNALVVSGFLLLRFLVCKNKTTTKIEAITPKIEVFIKLFFLDLS